METKWASCAVTGVWSSGRGGEAVRRAASALVVSLQEPWKGERAGAAMWAVTQERRTVKRETKRREKWLRSCHSLPACQRTCLLSGTRPSEGLDPEIVNSYKHSPMYMCTGSLVRRLTCTQLYVLKVHALAEVYRPTPDIHGFMLTIVFLLLCTSEQNYYGYHSSGAGVVNIGCWFNFFQRGKNSIY